MFNYAVTEPTRSRTSIFFFFFQNKHFTDRCLNPAGGIKETGKTTESLYIPFFFSSSRGLNVVSEYLRQFNVFSASLLFFYFFFRV